MHAYIKIIMNPTFVSLCVIYFMSDVSIRK